MEAEYDATERVARTPSRPTRTARGGRRPSSAWWALPTRSAGRCCGAGWRRADPDFRKVLLEVYARRYYRIRELRDLLLRRARRPAAVRRRLRLGEQAHPPRRRLRRAVPTAGHGPRRRRAPRAAYRRTGRSSSTWPPGGTGRHLGVEETAPVVEDLLARCDFGACPWRVDVTVTTTGGDEAEHFRTLHLSYRPKAGGGLLEDPLYRNLHPMLAKRLDLWRLSNFRLERLASAEDVYLFHGVAHDNPKDHRLFALAEVRDLTPGAWTRRRARSYPWLGRMGLQCAGRDAGGAGRPSRGATARPRTGSCCTSGRRGTSRASRGPTWPAPSPRWPRAPTWRRCCCGSGSPSRTGRCATPCSTCKVSAATGSRCSRRQPSNEPIRPLTPYRQKVLVAQRFGVPYPYEILRMLTARARSLRGLPAWHLRRARPRRRRPSSSRSTARAGAQHGERRGRGPHQPHGEGAGGDEPGRAAERPDPRAGQPRRAGVPQDPRCARPRRADAGAGRVVHGVLGRADRHGQRHREHGLDRRRAPRTHRVHPARRRDQHRGDRHQRGRPAVLERRGDDADAHPRHPGDAADQRHGADRQAGAGLLRRRLGRGQPRASAATTG